MSKVGSENTRPELAVRRLVHSLGYRYILHDKTLPGRPDMVFRGRKKIIFVHGCFWHLHKCSKGNPPKTKLDYWLPKLEANRCRDQKVLEELTSKGWKVLVIWQCEIKDKSQLALKLKSFLS